MPTFRTLLPGAYSTIASCRWPRYSLGFVSAIGWAFKLQACQKDGRAGLTVSVSSGERLTGMTLTGDLRWLRHGARVRRSLRGGFCLACAVAPCRAPSSGRRPSMSLGGGTSAQESVYTVRCRSPAPQPPDTTDSDALFSVDLDGHGLSRCCAIMRGGKVIHILAQRTGTHAAHFTEPRASWSRPHWRTEP